MALFVNEQGWYLHAASGYPTKATWLKAIKSGNFATLPRVIVKNVNKYFPESKETKKGAQGPPAEEFEVYQG